MDTVAALIGELLEYRAGGASHLEVAAGNSSFFILEPLSSVAVAFLVHKRNEEE